YSGRGVALRTSLPSREGLMNRRIQMRYRYLVSAGVLALAMASASLISVAAQAPAGQAAAAQAPAKKFMPPKSTYVAPKTPWGDPDIQGVFDYQSMIAMQRPAELAGKK